MTVFPRLMKFDKAEIIRLECSSFIFNDEISYNFDFSENKTFRFSTVVVVRVRKNEDFS